MKSKFLLAFLMFFLCLSLSLAARGTAPEEREEAEPAPPMEGPTVPETQYSEAPMLAEMVARGELPNVDERLPDEPVVIEIGLSTDLYTEVLAGLEEGELVVVNTVSYRDQLQQVMESYLQGGDRD